MSSLGETRHTTTLSFGVQHDYIKTAAEFGGVAQTRIFAEDESIHIPRIVEDNVIKEAGVAAKGGVVKVLLKATWSKRLLRQPAWSKKLFRQPVKEAVRDSRGQSSC